MAIAAKVTAEEVRIIGAQIEAMLGFKRKAMQTLDKPKSLPGLALALELACSLSLDNQVGMLKQQLIAINPPPEAMEYWQARLAFYDGKFGESLALCRQAKPSPMLDNLRGAIFYLQGNWNEAEQAFKTAIVGNAGMAEAWYNLASLYLTQGANVAAEDILETLAANPALRLDAHRVATTLAYVICRQNPAANYPRAMELLNQATVHSLPDAYSLYLSGEIAELAGKELWNKAVHDYRQSLALASDFTYPLVKLTALSLLQGQHDAAAHCLAETTARQAQLSIATQQQVDIMQIYLAIMSNNLPVAQTRLAEFLRLTPEHKTAWKLQAWLSHATGQSEQALSSLQKVLAIAPQDSYSLNAKERIRENMQQSLWEDSFSRPDSDFVRRRWIEAESRGIHILLRSGKVLIGGKELDGNVSTTLTRIVEEKNFAAISGKLDATYATSACVGLVVVAQATGNCLYFGKGNEQTLVYGIARIGELPKWQTILQNQTGLTWPTGIQSLAIAKDALNAGQYQLHCNGSLLLSIPFATKEHRRLQVGFFGVAEPGTVWSLALDDAGLVEK